MKFSAILALFAAAAVNACGEGADDFNDKDAAYSEVEAICNDGETIAGNFANAQEKTGCRDVSGQTINLYISLLQNDGNSGVGARLDPEPCIDGFRASIDNCDPYKWGDWTFNAYAADQCDAKEYY